MNIIKSFFWSEGSLCGPRGAVLSLCVHSDTDVRWGLIISPVLCGTTTDFSKVKQRQFWNRWSKYVNFADGSSLGQQLSCSAGRNKTIIQHHKIQGEANSLWWKYEYKETPSSFQLKNCLLEGKKLEKLNLCALPGSWLVRKFNRK